jgi:hypothetical protein
VQSTAGFEQDIPDSISANLVILNRSVVIRFANKAGGSFAIARHGETAKCGVGSNYLIGE